MCRVVQLRLGRGGSRHGEGEWALTVPGVLRAGGGGVDITDQRTLVSNTCGVASGGLDSLLGAPALPSSRIGGSPVEHSTYRLCCVAVAVRARAGGNGTWRVLCPQLPALSSLPHLPLPYFPAAPAAAAPAAPAPGEVKDKVQLYQMANLGVRLCWWAVMTWLVVLLAGCAVFSVYVSNMHYMMEVRADTWQHPPASP